MVYAHVIYKKTGLERKILPKAYQLISKSYTLLGYVDENDNPVDGPEAQVSRTQKKRDAEPVAEPRKQMTPEEIEAKKAELTAMNDAAIQKVKDEQAAKATSVGTTASHLFPNEIVKQRKKPGPKPKKNEA